MVCFEVVRACDLCLVTVVVVVVVVVVGIASATMISNTAAIISYRIVSDRIAMYRMVSYDFLS